jgi:hypothetical protein
VTAREERNGVKMNDMNGLTFTKSTCERYDLRFNKGWGWAIFTIDEKSGMFNCQSDYGTYNYMWPNHGRKSFKHFILELAKDPSYFLGKVSERDFFDVDASMKQWKESISNLRKRREISKEQAADMWEFINELDTSAPVALIQERIYNNKTINEVFEEPWYDFEVIKEYPPNARVFAHKIMPMFAEILSQEIMQHAG